MTYGKNQHILNASSNLLGICFVIITAIKVTHLNEKTLADDIRLMSAIAMMSAALLSYISMRAHSHSLICDRWADRTFLAGCFYYWSPPPPFTRAIERAFSFRDHD